MRTDPAKIQVVTNWPPLQSHKQLQRFLGYANIYQRLIRNYSQVVALLTKLTFLSVPFVLSPAAEEAFMELQQRFSSALVLVQPDPARQFVVEVDASDIGVGAVLSQRPAERNYDAGNHELLAVKLALGEWRYWRGRTHLLWYGLIIGIWLTFKLLNV